MKHIRLLFAAVLAIAFSFNAHASIKQVTTLGTTAATIIIPGIHATQITIQNTGTTNVRLTFDGGSTYTDPYAGKAGTDPTVSTGYLLAAGQQVILVYASPANLRPIRAISATATATLDITTNESGGSTFPTN
jgi:hypothetical protein